MGFLINLASSTQQSHCLSCIYSSRAKARQGEGDKDKKHKYFQHFSQCTNLVDKHIQGVGVRGKMASR